MARVREPRRKPRKLILRTWISWTCDVLAAKRVHQLVSIWEHELGGAAAMTESLRQLVQRAALLSVFIESNEVEWLAGGTLAEGTYFAAINSATPDPGYDRNRSPRHHRRHAELGRHHARGRRQTQHRQKGHGMTATLHSFMSRKPRHQLHQRIRSTSLRRWMSRGCLHHRSLVHRGMVGALY